VAYARKAEGPATEIASRPLPPRPMAKVVRAG